MTLKINKRLADILERGVNGVSYTGFNRGDFRLLEQGYIAPSSVNAQLYRTTNKGNKALHDYKLSLLLQKNIQK